MTLLASFNYSHSDPAVMIGGLVALGLAAALIATGRPWMAAGGGAVSWGLIGYLVGLAGRGDMKGLYGIIYGVMGLLSGAVIAGVGAWLRSRMRPAPASTERPGS